MGQRIAVDQGPCKDISSRNSQHIKVSTVAWNNVSLLVPLRFHSDVWCYAARCQNGWINSWRSHVPHRGQLTNGMSAGRWKWRGFCSRNTRRFMPLSDATYNLSNAATFMSSHKSPQSFSRSSQRGGSGATLQQFDRRVPFSLFHLSCTNPEHALLDDEDFPQPGMWCRMDHINRLLLPLKSRGGQLVQCVLERQLRMIWGVWDSRKGRRECTASYTSAIGIHHTRVSDYRVWLQMYVKEKHDMYRNNIVNFF